MMLSHTRLIDSFERIAINYRQLFLRLLAVIFVFILSALLPLVISVRQSQLLIGFALAAVGALIILRWPQLGLVLIFVGGMILPTVGPSGLNVPMVLVGTLMGLWLLDSIINGSKIQLTSSRPLVALSLFVVVSVLAFIVGQLPWSIFARNAPLDAQLGGLSMILLSAGAFLLAAFQIRDLIWLQRLTWAFLAVSGLYILGRIVPGMEQITRQVFQSQAIGGIFWACLPAIALSQALFNRELKGVWRVLFLTLTAGAIYAAYVQNYAWKSGWIPAMVGVFVVVWLWKPRAGLILTLFGSLLAVRLVPEILDSDAYSLSTRLDAWTILAEIVKVSPVIGLGFGNYYWYTPLIGIRGFDVSFNSHNNFVDIIAQIGILGLVCMFWFLYEIGRLGWQLRSRVPEGFPQAYVNGVLGAFVASIAAAMLGDWLLPFVYNIGLAGFRTGVLIWLLLGGLVMLGNLYPAERLSVS